MANSSFAFCTGDKCDPETHKGHTEDAILDHPAGLVAVVAVAGSIGVLYGMVAMLFAETFAA